jgi:hypothetical protein
MRRAGEPNHSDSNLYNFSNKFLESNSIFPFDYPSADKKR